VLNFLDSFTTSPIKPSVVVYFYAYYRDYQGSLTTQFKIYRPDGSVYTAWEDVPAVVDTFHSVWYLARTETFNASDPAGTWRFEAVYNGQVLETFFNLNAPPTLKVTSPNGGETFNPLLTYALTWTDNIGGNVNIALYRNGVYSAAIASNTPSDGAYLWSVDAALALGPGYTVRVSSVINPGLYDDSDLPFSLGSPRTVIARNDAVMIAKNTPITLDVLANDQAANNQSLTITDVGTPSHGTTSLVNAKILYTPGTDFLGMDGFVYTVKSGVETAQANVTVQVMAEIFRSFLPQIER
jgi:hypothetical protein